VDGRELFYRSGQRWMVTPVTTGGQIAVGSPTVLFEGPFLNPPGPSYDVTPDGKRFLVLVPVGEDAPLTRVNLVVNWFQELRAKVPVQKSR
jgi:hypothetical protein